MYVVFKAGRTYEWFEILILAPAALFTDVCSSLSMKQFFLHLNLLGGPFPVD
jgi:hypothetical protein